jgi:hypothetical protein
VNRASGSEGRNPNLIFKIGPRNPPSLRETSINRRSELSGGIAAVDDRSGDNEETPTKSKTDS